MRGIVRGRRVGKVAGRGRGRGSRERGIVRGRRGG